ncbi:MAG TPA: zinc metalloprotease HtpX [Myxococcaceae bacterium]|jgi:heat shock protein HtpX
MNQLRTVLLLGILSAILVGLGGVIGPNALGFSLVLAVVMNLGAYFFSDRIVLAMHRAQELSPAEAPELHRMVAELSARAGIPVPRLYLIPEAQPNAFATGRNPEHAVVAVTSGILEVLDRRELRGVLAHELAHVKNRDILVSSIAATVAAAITYVAHAVGFFGAAASDDDGPSPVQSLLLALVAPIAATLIQLGISRSREYGADVTGAEISGDADSLARALEKLDQAAHAIPAPMQPATASLFIVNPFSATEGILNLFSTHPSMRERIRRLRAMHPSSGGWPVGARDATIHAGG